MFLLGIDIGTSGTKTVLFDEVGNQIREVGKEYGTTTGRPRRSRECSDL